MKFQQKNFSVYETVAIAFPVWRSFPVFAPILYFLFILEACISGQ